MLHKVMRDGALRQVVTYDDNDGITILFDDDATRRRFEDEPFDYDIDGLIERMNEHELVAFGTHDGDFESVAVIAVDNDFELEEKHENGVADTFECGIIEIESQLVVTDWSKYSFGCDVDAGEVEGDRLEVAPGRYAVSVCRNYGPDDEIPDEGAIYLISLTSTDKEGKKFRELPGADGWF
jgi:hypothetical protein